MIDLRPYVIALICALVPLAVAFAYAKLVP
ncbi:hypothetical protein FHW02_004326 [Ochrobactrum sp. RH1CCR137]|nr:hypothetical protein [Ochrobactrum sp. RH1CCR137]MBA8858055.1 hypothetical protein [Ochrobactrum sp. RH1CCR134]